MAKLFIGIAAAFMLATAVVGFLLKGKVDTLQAARREAVGKIQVAQGQATNAKNEAEKAKKDLKDATDKLEDAEKKASDAVAKAGETKKALDELTIVDGGKDKQIADLTEKLAHMPAGADPAKIAELQAQLADLTTKVDDANKKLAEKDQIIASLNDKSKPLEEKLAKLERLEKDRELKVGKAGLRARILAVNSGWNFVVLDKGDKAGVSLDDPIIVVRGSEPVARLRVTSVEPSTCIADVIPASVRRGISVQPGDTVIFQGRTSATMPENKTLPEATTTNAPAAQPPQ
jgi:F0F1-type ATP synthase membrane subunit b/b'